MDWKCPVCSSLNKDHLVRCACGHEMKADNRENNILPPASETHEKQDHPGPGQPGELALVFTGSGREYFRVWVVNLCLTLLTLGIFSAWAKVRKKRYFYSNTTLDGTPLQYLGEPVPILKGRVIAATAFMIYYLASHFFSSLMPFVLAAGTVLAPWVIVRSTAFNARYSAFRNMTFRFDGKYTGALKAIYAWGLIPAIVAGWIFNWYGKYPAAAVLFGVFGLTFPWWIRRLKNFIVGFTSYGNKRGEFSATGGQFFKVYFSAGLIFIAIIFVTSIAATATYAFLKNPQILFLFSMVPIYLGYVMAYAYVQAHSSNLVWNSTRLGPLRFASTLSACGLTKLYIANAVAIIASAGLLIPWAVMRTLKYRVDNLRVLQEGGLTAFQGSETSAVQAAGAEMGDFFNMDLSL
ncbi:MAG: DUF898 family protein [Nitrospirota bacterium]|nr:DUF898 family protein [Nitrospirota bacterium]